MTGQRQILEMNARAIAIIQYYHDGLKAQKSRAMNSEIQTVAKWFVEAKVADNIILKRVMKPIETELINRYGYEMGARLYAEFLEAFCATDVPRKPARGAVASQPRCQATEE